MCHREGRLVLLTLSCSMQMTMTGEELTAATIQQVNTYEWTVDPFTEKMTRQSCAELSEYIGRLANEPSVGLHHVTTHMHTKGMPRAATVRDSLQGVTREAEAAAYDAGDSTRSVRAMHELVALKNTKDAIARSVMLVEQMLAAPPRAKGTPGRPVTPGLQGQQRQQEQRAGMVVGGGGGGGGGADGHEKKQETITFKSF